VIEALQSGAESPVHRLGALVAGEVARDVALSETELRVGHAERSSEPAHPEAVSIDPDAETPGDLAAE
jgi:hypothetical protein